MEIYTFVLCCTLVSSVVAFTLPDIVPEYKNDTIAEVAERQDCKCKNGRCVTNKQGKTKCNCYPGHAIQDENTCEPCDCGKRGKCMFIGHPKSSGDFSYEKKCLCDVGSAEKDGMCVDCQCGENSKCEFEGDEKMCYCIEGYSEKNGVCTECNCGFYGECEFKMGKKVCTCDEDFLEHDGNCIECNCGPFGECSLRGGGKMCKCYPEYSDNDGTCEKCDCGEYSSGCEFKEGQKICHCDKDKAQHKDRCVDCNCGEQSVGCQFVNDEKICQCSDGYIQKDDVCKVKCSKNRPCQNGGNCEEGICSCLPGTSGDFCEVIDWCSGLCPEQPDIKCTYDTVRQKAYCKCLNEGTGFYPDTKKCRETCDDSLFCKNFGQCLKHGDYSSFCDCREGTTGDLCEIVQECYEKDCGSDAKCQYLNALRSARCVCFDSDLAFDPDDRKCKKTCQENSDCMNGGECTQGELSKLCLCLEGTKGDFCEVVTGCEAKNCGNNAKCVYDVDKRIAVCVCDDENFAFDPVEYRCRRICREESDCQNGGTCTDGESSRFCRCLEGTTGDFCEEVSGCDSMDCGFDANCLFDKDKGTASCVCRDSAFGFHPVEKLCKRTCFESSDCKNGGTCTEGEFFRVCQCLEGTEGDLCEKVPGCDSRECGNDARCVYSVRRKAEVCLCKDKKLSFDPADIRCKRPCFDSKDCKNGGACVKSETQEPGIVAFPFCRCLEGTEGDLCEKVVKNLRG